MLPDIKPNKSKVLIAVFGRKNKFAVRIVDILFEKANNSPTPFLIRSQNYLTDV